MRIIERAENESLVIDNRIEIRVLEIQDDRVRVAISDPDQIPAYREELIYLRHAEMLQLQTT